MLSPGVRLPRLLVAGAAAVYGQGRLQTRTTKPGPPSTAVRPHSGAGVPGPQSPTTTPISVVLATYNAATKKALYSGSPGPVSSPARLRRQEAGANEGAERTTPPSVPRPGPARVSRGEALVARNDDLTTYVDYDTNRGGETISRAELNRLIRWQEWSLARRVLLNRAAAAAWVLAAVSSLVAGVLTTRWLDQPSRLALADTICGVVFAASAGVLAAVRRVKLPSRRELSLLVDNNREAQRWVNVNSRRPLADRRNLYREEVTDLIEQFRADSRRYLRVHNSLQILVMTGSAGSTTVAALQWGQQPTWQGITLTGISFAITLASAFTGYYKYRERSYFLQETADSIEEQANALTLGVGDYASLKDADALARFMSNPQITTLRGSETSPKIMAGTRPRAPRTRNTGRKGDTGSHQPGTGTARPAITEQSSPYSISPLPRRAPFADRGWPLNTVASPLRRHEYMTITCPMWPQPTF